MADEQKWPDTIWIVRHGQSAGNVAREVAEKASSSIIDLATRDVDTPLSRLGEEQAKALGHWFGSLPSDQQPSVVFSSPFLRSITTARYLMQAAGLSDDDVTFRVDERLREKEFGILDRLTKLGVSRRYPELSAQREHVGKFYFRPPGGESWCDVVLRLRSILDTLTRDYRQERVLIVAHQVVVNCFRYLIERLNETQVLAVDKASDVPNCGVTSYQFQPDIGRAGKMVLQVVNFTAPLKESGAPITADPDLPENKNAGA